MGNNKKYYVTIAYGESMESWDTHFFDTEKEREAFIEGVEIGCGWLEHAELEKGITHSEKEEKRVICEGKTPLNSFREDVLGWGKVS
ncbi:MAG: hypothetical protein GY909_15625 [Oligoflexia bacterium]|nr:hypothetical protein [Oligoflexia bacterium]